MIVSRPGLPNFDNPPVTEVALAVQFEPLSALRTTQIVLLWNEFRERFPKIEEHLPRTPAFEEFGIFKPGKIDFQLHQEIPVPRFWFLNDSGTELIQIQQDRFVHNWRKFGKGEEYPRYPYIREMFQSELDIFRQFLDREKLGELVPNQCEVTYVNQIIEGQGWERRGQLEQLFTVWRLQYSDSFLQEPEEISFSVQYLIPGDDDQPIGRLHINVQPAIRREDEKLIIALNITARGKPPSNDLEGILSFLDTGREWVIRGFTSITTNKMHQIWERTDES